MLTVSTFTYAIFSIYYIQFVAELMLGLVGGYGTIFTATVSIVTDEIRHELAPSSKAVPLRIVVATVVQSIGILLGTLVATMCTLLDNIASIGVYIRGYTLALSIATLSTIAALLYAAFRVRETHHREDLIYVPGRCIALKTFVHEIFEVLTAPRPGWSRFCLNVSICLVFVDFLASDSSLLLMMVKLSPFDWSDTTFTIFSLIRAVSGLLGMSLVPFAFSKTEFLGQDSLLIMIAVLGGCVQSLLYSFATCSSLIFIAGSFAFLAGCISPGYRTFLPRLVAKEETARLCSLFSTIVVLFPLFATVIFNNIFNATVTVWPGFAFFIASILQFIVFVIQIILHWLLYPQWKNSYAPLDDDLLESTATGEAWHADDEFSDVPCSKVEPGSNRSVDDDGADNVNNYINDKDNFRTTVDSPTFTHTHAL